MSQENASYYHHDNSITSRRHDYRFERSRHIAPWLLLHLDTDSDSSGPDPPFAVLDSERITMSKAAHPLGVPDALPGLASFAATLTLVLLAKRSPAARKLLGFKLTLDASAAAFNAGRQVIAFRSLCFWCTGTALAAGMMAYAGRGVIRNAWSTAENIAEASTAGYKGTS